MSLRVPARIERGRSTRRWGVAAYLTITFALAWSGVTFAAVGAAPFAVLLMPLAPAIGCVVVRRWVTREGFADLGLRPSLRAAARRWPFMLVALGWPVLAAPMVAGFSGNRLELPLRTAMSWVLLSVAVTPVILGEELGWRGYLQQRLCPGQPARAAALTGVIWGVWHYPLLLTTRSAAHPLTLLAFTLGCVTISFLLGWLRARTGSIWTPAMGHASNNVTEDNLTRRILDGPASGGDVAAVLLAEAVVVLAVHTVGRRSMVP